jgi:hypothetical protein
MSNVNMQDAMTKIRNLLTYGGTVANEADAHFLATGVLEHSVLGTVTARPYSVAQKYALGWVGLLVLIEAELAAMLHVNTLVAAPASPDIPPGTFSLYGPRLSSVSSSVQSILQRGINTSSPPGSSYPAMVGGYEAGLEVYEQIKMLLATVGTEFPWAITPGYPASLSPAKMALEVEAGALDRLKVTFRTAADADIVFPSDYSWESFNVGDIVVINKFECDGNTDYAGFVGTLYEIASKDTDFIKLEIPLEDAPIAEAVSNSGATFNTGFMIRKVFGA